jgi:NADH dehydrogenase (ubiquinone) 1 beta subcomplex subunit 10
MSWPWCCLLIVACRYVPPFEECGEVEDVAGPGNLDVPVPPADAIGGRLRKPPSSPSPPTFVSGSRAASAPAHLSIPRLTLSASAHHHHHHHHPHTPWLTTPPSPTCTVRRALLNMRARADGPAERVKAREAHMRESWVRAMEARIVRDELQRCQRAEGVNSYETCRDLAERYLSMLRDNRVRAPVSARPSAPDADAPVRRSRGTRTSTSRPFRARNGLRIVQCPPRVYQQSLLQRRYDISYFTRT